MARSEDAPDLDLGSRESVERWRDTWETMRACSREALAQQVWVRQEARRLRTMMRGCLGEGVRKLLGP